MTQANEPHTHAPPGVLLTKKNTTMKKATYTNKATQQTYTLSGVKNIGQAWNLAGIVCDRMNWNLDMFACDVRITLS